MKELEAVMKTLGEKINHLELEVDLKNYQIEKLEKELKELKEKKEVKENEQLN